MWKLCCCMVIAVALAPAGQSQPENQEKLSTTGVAEAQKPATPQPVEAEREGVSLRRVLSRMAPTLFSQEWPGQTTPRALILDLVQRRDGTTRITISEAPEMEIVPVVTDMPQRSAEETLEKIGFPNVKTQYMYDDTRIPGDVISQIPAGGESAETKTTVELLIAQTEIAIQPYPCRTDVMANRPTWGQLIVHRPFDVQLEEGIQHVPMFAVMYEGQHHARRGNGRGALEARAKCIAERLAIAWDLMDEGGYLEVTADEWIRPDDGQQWRLSDPYKPRYDEKAISGQHAIYVRHENLGRNPLRIMTVYRQDAGRFGQADALHEDGETVLTSFDTGELAEYLVAVIKAHHLLFSMRSDKLADYEKLEICKTREGRIFKEICLRARETVGGAPDVQALKDSLARIAMDQRYRLERLADTPPRDWRFRND